MKDTAEPDLDGLGGQQLVALHVASNQVELIFSDTSGENDCVVLVGRYVTRGHDGGIQEWTVPHGSQALVPCLDQHVDRASFDASGRLEVRFECGRSITIVEDAHTPWWEVVRVGPWPPKFG